MLIKNGMLKNWHTIVVLCLPKRFVRNGRQRPPMMHPNWAKDKIEPTTPSLNDMEYFRYTLKNGTTMPAPMPVME